MFKIPRSRAAVAALLLAMVAPGTLASVVLTGTRVIYPESEREVTLKLTNEGESPTLVQAWIDDGNPDAAPEEAKAPFTLTPPLFRLDPAKGQTLRIIHLPSPLPGDRESLFWLNVLEVPPIASGDADRPNSLQFAFRTRIKLFFRPTGLAGDADSAPLKVTWRLGRTSNGQQVLTASNPTPYHITYIKVDATVRGNVYGNDAGAMVGPGATVDFPIADTPVDAGEPDRVHYRTLNDFGAGADGVHESRPAGTAQDR
ncbi:molecular chaperone [Cupriavidus sp. D384]|uniref:fimbrial biogenesis chaperone n=1 Tax=Cupriavidus sp. D384 TaxID=1538095 RepID=UPI000835C8C5|nr:fimbria/pilus periplasmic chaperone [Cupriavidus sp. D384]